MSTPNNAASTPLPRLEIHPLKKGLPRGQALATKALVRVVSDAPVTEQQRQRAPIDLAIVIDRSGSMSGEPLAAALGCARNLIRGLRETDRVAVVVFDNQVNVLQPLAQVADRETVCRLLSEVRAGGSTALFAGWEEGARQLAPFTSANRTSRVILLTDGQANQGLVNEDEIAEAVRLYFRCCHTIAEGAGAAPLAALIKERDAMKGQRVGVILSGGNIDMPKFASVLEGRTPEA